MTATTLAAEQSTTVVPEFAPTLRRLHAAAVARILFGIVWAIDATFKFLPGFVHGQTLEDELGKGAEVQTPVIHLPWSKPGITDLGPSVGYIFASLGLYLAVAGATWSLDQFIQPRLGRLAPLASRTVNGTTSTGGV